MRYTSYEANNRKEEKTSVNGSVCVMYGNIFPQCITKEKQDKNIFHFLPNL